MATRTISDAGGNYNSTGTWVEGAVPTSADDVVATATSGNLTVTAAAAAKTVNFTNYVGTFVINSSQTLTVSGSVTLVSGMTWTASTGKLIFNASATLTTNGKTIPCEIECISYVTITLAENITVNGNVSFGNSSGTTVNGYTLTCAGGAVFGGGSRTLGTTVFKVTGGNIGSTHASIGRCISNPIEIAGNVTFTANLQVSGNTLTYTSGTITWGGYYLWIVSTVGGVTLAGAWPSGTNISARQNSTLVLGQNQTINDLSIDVNGTLTLSGSYDLTCTSTTFTTTTGTIALNRSTHAFGTIVVNTGISGAFSGSYDIPCTNLYLRAGSTLTIPASRTVTVSTAMSICGCADTTTTLKSGTASTAFTLTYNGTVDNLTMNRAALTDVTFTTACYAFNSGTLTRTSGVTDFTPSDIITTTSVTTAAGTVTFSEGSTPPSASDPPVASDYVWAVLKGTYS